MVKFKRIKASRDLLGFRIKKEMELLPFLYEAFSNRSRNSVKSILRRGQVSVIGRETTQFNDKLEPGDIVSVLKNEAAKRLGALVGIEILYEDEDLIALYKDDGLLSVATEKEEIFTVHFQMMEYVKHQHPKNRIYIVHRLDQDTSGVMLVAKNKQTQQFLQKNWQKVVPERSYLAVVEGEVERKQGTIESWLKETKTHYVYSTKDHKNGLHAITHYERIQTNGDYTLVKIKLETGRKNQIRVHMKDLGHPVAGDKKYNAQTDPINRLALHAEAITCLHPRTKKKERIIAKAPRSFYSISN